MNDSIDDGPQTRSSTTGWGLWLWWVIATTAAFTGGGRVTAELGQQPVTAEYFGLAVAGILATALQGKGLIAGDPGRHTALGTGYGAASGAGLVALVRRPFHRRNGDPATM